MAKPSGRGRLPAIVTALAIPAATATWPAGAVEFQLSPDTTVRWDNTLSYTLGARVNDQSPKLINTNASTDDGDRNFDAGSLILNRIDLLSEFDVTYRNLGARVSAAAWYDQVYNQKNDNDSPATANALSVPFNEFTKATKKLHGRDYELLDAFVAANGDLGGGVTGGLRLGRHALLWGESLFFGSNAVANGQSSIDVTKLLSSPNAQFKEIVRPRTQVSGELSLTPDLTLAAYYQFEWEPTRVPAAGSYFANADPQWSGGDERLLAGPSPVPGAPPLAFFHGNDLEPDGTGQGGLSLRMRLDELDLGIYALRYHDQGGKLYTVRSPGPPNFATGSLGQFYWAFPKNVETYGASASTTFGNLNVAGEMSMRSNAPFVSSGLGVAPGAVVDNDDNPLYAVGKSLHANASLIWSTGPTFLAREAMALGEVAANRRISTTKNLGALDPNGDKNAIGFRMVFEPRYRQVLPGLDLSVPLGFSYFPAGKSSVVANFGPDNGGDISIGLKGEYLNVWRFRAAYTHFYGPEDSFIDAANRFPMKQSLKDRDFVVFAVSRTF